MRAPFAAVLTVLLASACVPAGREHVVPDPQISRDLGVIDAGEEAEAGMEIGADAAVEEKDAGSDPDAEEMGSPDAGAYDSGYGACTVNGIEGECVEVTRCTEDREHTPGFCPGPAEIQCCTPRGSTFVCDPAEQKDPNAGLNEAPSGDGCPSGMLRIEAAIPFCIDRYEAALIEIHADGSETTWSPYHHPGSANVRAFSAEGAVPQGYLDGETAADACAASNKRLCTNTEWLRACRGPDTLLYPYGDQRMNGVCNDARARHPAVELFPNDPTPFDRIQDACINQLPASLDLTGENAGCLTAEGAFDMMGNLHEWTADPMGTFRGGFYVDTVMNGEGCLYATTAHNTLHWDYSTGFRCCAEPGP
jgi:hypothetical protein